MKQKRRKLNLAECPCLQNGSKPLQVDQADPEHPVVRRVKILGFESLNARRYLPEAVRKKLSYYEGCKVNIDHRFSDQGSPSTRLFGDRFGRIKNVTMEADGPYGDLSYNPRHPLAETFAWWAQNDPSAIGLSHNAEGEGYEDDDGTFVVDEIHEVHSVDLVADPATTKGLHESRSPMAKKKKPAQRTFKEAFEASKSPHKTELVALLEEMGDMYADMPAPEADIDGDGQDDAEQGGHKQHLLAAIESLLDSDDEESQSLVKKIMALLTMKQSETTTEGDDGQDDDNDGDDDDSKQVESAKGKKGNLTEAFAELKAKVDAYETRDRRLAKIKRAKQLCQKSRLPESAVTKAFLGTLVACRDEKKMQRLIEDRRAILGKGLVKKPVSSGPGASDDKISYDQFMEGLAESLEE